MAITNQERVGKALELLRQGIAPFIEREFKNTYKKDADDEALRFVGDDRNAASTHVAEWDVALLLKLVWTSWKDVLSKTLGNAERSLVQEVRDVRNNWAHQKAFTSDDTDRALDSIARFLTAISAPQADEVTKMKQELRRLIYDEQVRAEKRKTSGSLIDTGVSTSMKPWREVVTPHADVASGKYQQAEFAADLWQVHLGEGSDEYRDPVEFFKRTFLTESLTQLLIGGVQRLSGTGGDPVVQLQTNFGGGKTHSMLALYHLFSGVKPNELAGVDAALASAGHSVPNDVRRVVLVGNKISPGNPVTKKDGTIVRTLWGELAYQLGGKKAYDRIALDDERATSPGDVLRELFVEYGPCLILIDEWVSYARQLHEQSDLPAGSFETQFSFAQVLTESAKDVKNCLLIVSLPASDTSGSPHTRANDVEVGGIRGREALDRLRNVVGRVESSWRPASAEEGFEIVRRRLFEPLVGADAFKQRDVTARSFADLYSAQGAEFPLECKGGEYEKRMQAAYPIHPEIFDRLYTDWSTLVKFQRTRGVLRLMAAVIHSLWERGDRSPMIMPSSIPIDDPRVQAELTRYLSDNWVPIIEKDVDGPNSLPLRIDADQPNLGKLSAARRVARTIYLGSAPMSEAAHRGLEDRRVKLGCVMPGESPAVFGDALRRLAASATYLYQDGSRAWYATQPTVTKLADDRAEQLIRDPDKIAHELESRLRQDLRKIGDFSRVHPLPPTNADVPDDHDTRLVVLKAEHSFSKEHGSAAEKKAVQILASRGNSPRIYKNTLVFLAADRVRLQDLEEAIRKYLAWSSILAEKDVLNLDPHQVRQAETQKQSAELTLTSRVPETYQWLLVPEQRRPQDEITWTSFKLSGNDALAARASKRLRSEDLLVSVLGPTVLRKHMDDVPLWSGDSIAVRKLTEHFASYLYLPRLAGPEVLVNAIKEGVALLTWQTETFAYADAYDLTTGRFQGLRAETLVAISADSSGLVVKPHVARLQMDADAQPKNPSTGNSEPGEIESTDNGTGSGTESTEAPKFKDPTRYYGTVDLDPTRVGRDAGKIAEEVIAHLAGLVGATVHVTLEISAEIPNGANEKIVRTVTENGNSLKFRSQGFERE